MKSPFPGMDPYIEACGLFEDFHNHFVEHISDHLATLVPDRYVVRTGERSYVVLVETDEKKSHPFLPDVKVCAPVAASAAPGATTVLAEADAEAVSMRAFIDLQFRESFVEIYDTEPEHRLVTSIEVLSPSNKRPSTDGWKIYLRKRQALLLGAANFVEIDLLRGGTRMPMLDPWPQPPYYALVCRQSGAPNCKVWPAHFDRPLPTLAVPLATPDPDLSLPLQPLVDGIYQRYRYRRSIDYQRPLSPPLTQGEQQWLAEQLKAQQGPR